MSILRIKAIVLVYTIASVHLWSRDTMRYVHLNTIRANFFGRNQLFKQCWTITFCILYLLGSTAIDSVRAANECDSFPSCCDTGENCRQFYIGGIVGADFGTLTKEPGQPTTVPNQSLFTGGGTVGMRSLRDNGAWRFEFEGRGRDQISSTLVSGGTSATTAARDGWSTMVNVWRDYEVVGDFNLYAGGGIGAGGYRSVINSGFAGLPPTFTSNDNVSNFAWQAGGGLIYNVSNHFAVDLGYRFFSLGDMTATGSAPSGPFSYATNYAASELLLTLRIYEPFRRWQ